MRTIGFLRNIPRNIRTFYSFWLRTDPPSNLQVEILDLGDKNYDFDLLIKFLTDKFKKKKNFVLKERVWDLQYYFRTCNLIFCKKNSIFKGKCPRKIHQNMTFSLKIHSKKSARICKFFEKNKFTQKKTLYELTKNFKFKNFCLAVTCVKHADS
jgi:hypothetical protein